MRGQSPEFSDETLLGYLLGGLSDDETAQIDDALIHSDLLRQRLTDLRGLLEPVSAMDDSFEPRAGLVADTLSLVATVEEKREDSHPQSQGTAELSDAKRLDWSDVPDSSRIAWMDSFVTIAAGVIFLSLLLPSIWHWREAARQFACAENLRNVGFGLLSYVNLSPARQIPPIEVSGPKAFAGMYAIHLRDRDLLETPSWVHCPSNRLLSELAQIPTSAQFLAATPEQQRLLRYMVGGNYAYNLGVWIDGQYETPKLDAPVRFAVLGDMWPSSNGVVQETAQPPVLHGDRAANMFYNDGSIRLIRIPSQAETESLSASSIDNPFLNREWEQGVGIGIQDACLGPSYWRPAIDIDRPR
jgi:hypothetical protein